VELKCATLEKITRNINKGEIVNLKNILWAQSRRISMLLTKKDWRACWKNVKMAIGYQQDKTNEGIGSHCIPEENIARFHSH
jgi:hypothetical protein